MNYNQAIPSSSPARRQPWNKGKLIGAKPPLRASHVWSIRTKLQLEGRIRDLALFNFAIDSKLRGCDVVAVRVDEVAPNGYALDRATVRQKKMVARSGSKSPSRRGRPSTSISELPAGSLASSCSPVAAATVMG